MASLCAVREESIMETQESASGCEKSASGCEIGPTLRVGLCSFNSGTSSSLCTRNLQDSGVHIREAPEHFRTNASWVKDPNSRSADPPCLGVNSNQTTLPNNKQK
eukprot:6086872-Amphidinium_carterae.1